MSVTFSKSKKITRYFLLKLYLINGKSRNNLANLRRHNVIFVNALPTRKQFG